MSNSTSKQKLKQKYKARKQRHRKRTLWPLVAAAGGILLIAAFFVFSNRDSDSGGTPAIAVDQKLIDYGDVKFDDEKTFAITITNTGDGTLRLKEEPYIEIVEGC